MSTDEEKRHVISTLAYHMGWVGGALGSPIAQEALKERGVPLEDQKVIRAILVDFAERAFYASAEEPSKKS